MNGKKKAKSVFLAATAVALSGGLYFGVHSALAAETQAALPPEAVLVGAEFEENYRCGQVLTLPAATLRIGDEEIETTVVVVYPDGEAKRTNKVFFSDAGIYEIRYRATVGEFEVSQSRYLTVTGDGEADENDPVITVDYSPFTEETLPEEVPVNCKFPVFAASAYDAASGAARVNVRVFYDYYNFETRYELDVADGYFQPDKAGDYTLMYTAEDAFKNRALLLKTVKVTDTEVPLSLEVTEIEEEPMAGNVVRLPECSFGGGIGRLTLSVAAIDEDGNEIDCTGGSFRPMQFGEYRIVYTLKDAVGQEMQKEYSLYVNYNTDPVFLESAALPKYFLEGVEYTLPALTAYDLLTETYVDAEITAIDGGGRSLITGAYMPVADGNGMAKIVYEAETDIGAAQETYTVPVIRAFTSGEFGVEFDQRAYFHCKDMQASADDAAVTLTANKQSGDASFEFVREIYADGMELVLGIDKNRNNFSRMNFWLEDAEDATRSVKFSFMRGEASASMSYLYINDVETTMATDVTFFSGKDYTFTYDEASRLFKEGQNIGNAYLNEYFDGRAFEGFPSGRVYFRVELIGVTGESAISVKSINQQTISSTTFDAVSPTIKFLEEYSSNYLYGETVKLWKCFVIDVLDPAVTASMSVTYRPNTNAAWQTLRSTDGVLLSDCPLGEYEIKLDGYGEYRVAYVFEDRSNFEVSAFVNFSVLDLTGPEIETNLPDRSVVKKGDHIDFPQVRVTDNSAGDCEYKVFLTDPSGEMHLLKETSGGFYATEAGLYKIQIMAIDPLGNITMRTYVIIAEE